MVDNPDMDIADPPSSHVLSNDERLQRLYLDLKQLRMADNQAEVEFEQVTILEASTAVDSNTKQDIAIDGSPINGEDVPQTVPEVVLEEVTAPTRNMQHLIHRRERRSHRSHAEVETFSFPLVEENSSSALPRPDYAARNRELQSRPRRNHYIQRCSKGQRPRHVVPRQTIYTSVFTEMKSQIINDLVERPSEIDTSLRRFLRWYRGRFPRDDPNWHQYKAEWAVWMRFYKGHPKREAFIGVEPNIPRGYTRRERELIYEDSKLGSLMKRIGI